MADTKRTKKYIVLYIDDGLRMSEPMTLSEARLFREKQAPFYQVLLKNNAHIVEISKVNKDYYENEFPL